MAQRDTTQPEPVNIEDNNRQQLLEIVKIASPELYQLMMAEGIEDLAKLIQAMQYSEINQDALEKMLYSVANIKRFARYGVVQVNIADGKEIKVSQKQQFVIPQDDD